MEVFRNWLCGGIITVMLAALPPDCRGADLPDTITLGSLARLYEKVTFNHAKHIVLVKDCAVCHHHTTGTLVEDSNCVRCHRNSSETKVVACRGCHLAQPFSAQALREKEANTHLYHLDRPGLKGAYHLSCMGCHEKAGGPTDCLSCHKRTVDGNALYRAAEFAPKNVPGKGSHH